MQALTFCTLYVLLKIKFRITSQSSCSAEHYCIVCPCTVGFSMSIQQRLTSIHVKHTVQPVLLFHIHAFANLKLSHIWLRKVAQKHKYKWRLAACVNGNTRWQSILMGTTLKKPLISPFYHTPQLILHDYWIWGIILRYILSETCWFTSLQENMLRIGNLVRFVGLIPCSSM